jgi:type IX secretion system PorP/SprF family membrane protein
MKTKNILTALFCMIGLASYAQQDAGFSMYFFNPVYINPGYAGSRELFSGTLVHRSQWIGMEGAPTTQSITVHSAIPNSKVGLGLQVYNDDAGPMKNTGIKLTYAYHLKVTENAKLSFGIAGMMNNIRIGWDQINVDDNTDPSFIGNDANSWVPDASAGLYLYKTRFYAGLSANHLLESKFNLSSSPGADMAKFSRQFYLTSGIVLPLSTNLDLRPAVMIKYVKAAPIVSELNASLIFYQKIFIGAGFRTGKRIEIDGSDNMLIGIAQIQLTNMFSLGYSYDYYLNRTGSYNSGTHEICLGWDISGVRTKMSNPRFF